MSTHTAPARTALFAAIESSCTAVGEAQWTHGYRAARAAFGAESEAEDQRLFDKQRAQWEACGRCHGAVILALEALIRAVRADARDASRRNKRRHGATTRTRAR